MGKQDNNFEVLSRSPAETMRLGERIAEVLRGGEVMCLVGQLGSGKTHLIKGIARGLGASDDEVTSPTFVLVNEYTGDNMRLDVYHVDAYRLGSVVEFERLGFDDLCYGRSVVLIEWADRVASALRDIDCICVELEHIKEGERKISVRNISQPLPEQTA